MEEQPINIIRASTRNLLQINRKMLRDQETDTRRSVTITENKISEQTIRDVVNIVKRNKLVEPTDLKTLKNCLMEDRRNIDLVLNIHGALRGIIRELTASPSSKSVEAAGCLCNLALGDERACLTVAKAAGSYLTTLLGNYSIELAVTCAWTLGNLAGCNKEVCNILVSQGALAKLSTPQENQEKQDAFLYAMVHFAYQMDDDLSVECLSRILYVVSQLDLTMASTQLIFILSCHNLFPNVVPDKQLHKILNEIEDVLYSHLQSCPNVDLCCPLTYMVRILANFGSFSYYAIIADAFMTHKKCAILFKKCLQIDNMLLCRSIILLFTNLNQYCEDKRFFVRFNECIPDCLEIIRT